MEAKWLKTGIVQILLNLTLVPALILGYVRWPLSSYCHVLDVCEIYALSLSRSLFLSFSLSGVHSSDSEGHFGTPEAETPVHALPTFPGELENSDSDPDKGGEATAE